MVLFASIVNYFQTLTIVGKSPIFIVARFQDPLSQAYETNKQKKTLFTILKIYSLSELLQLSSLYNPQYLQFMEAVAFIMYSRKMNNERFNFITQHII